MNNFENELTFVSFYLNLDLRTHPEINVWLINTGWTGGSFGYGNRISLSHTRRMIQAVLMGELKNVHYHSHEHFNICIPEHIGGIPEAMLNPRLSWNNEDAYDEAANHLSELFIGNFQKYADKASPETKAAVPRILTSHH